MLTCMDGHTIPPYSCQISQKVPVSTSNMYDIFPTPEGTQNVREPPDYTGDESTLD